MQALITPLRLHNFIQNVLQSSEGYNLSYWTKSSNPGINPSYLTKSVNRENLSVGTSVLNLDKKKYLNWNENKKSLKPDKQNL